MRFSTSMAYGLRLIVHGRPASFPQVQHCTAEEDIAICQLVYSSVLADSQ